MFLERIHTFFIPSILFLHYSYLKTRNLYIQLPLVKKNTGFLLGICGFGLLLADRKNKRLFLPVNPVCFVQTLSKLSSGYREQGDGKAKILAPGCRRALSVGFPCLRGSNTAQYTCPVLRRQGRYLREAGRYIGQRSRNIVRPDRILDFKVSPLCPQEPNNT